MSAVPLLFVGCAVTEESREQIYSNLKSRVVKAGMCDEVSILDFPLNLKFRAFDDLIRNVDDLAKHDNFTENVLRRIERQTLEIDPTTEFKIMWQRNTFSVDQYIRRFVWDDAKYPRSRSVQDNIELLLTFVTKLDDDVRSKATAWHEVRSQSANVAKKESASLVQRDLLDVLTPDVIEPGDFIETEHLTTAVVCVPRGMEKEWESHYESLEQFVVPRSTKKFPVSDKDGNTLWRAVLFKSALESFKLTARNNRFTVRDFKFSEHTFQKNMENRSKLEAEKSRLETFLVRICFAAFSDVFVAWMHVKAMRMFCEAVLRFGVPPHFASFLLRPPSESAEKKLRKELENLFTPKGMFGKHFMGGPGRDMTAGDIGDEEFYSYISLSMLPLAGTKNDNV